MAKKTYQTLKAELDEANDYIAELEEKIEEIAGIVTDEDEDDDGELEDELDDDEPVPAC
jgi:hypothetical protein